MNSKSEYFVQKVFEITSTGDICELKRDAKNSPLKNTKEQVLTIVEVCNMFNKSNNDLISDINIMTNIFVAL
jgi:outer membrane scaffolding protein for murein synthesis (MipA/OmpV family)